MKRLKKINRGIILLVLALMGVVIYLFISAFTLDDDKSQITDTVKDYLNAEMSCYVISEDELTLSNASEEKAMQLKHEIENKIKPYYVDHSALLDARAVSIFGDIISQAALDSYISDCKKQNIKVTDLSVKDNYAYVTVKSETVAVQNGNSVKNSVSDNLTLMKTKDGWRVASGSVASPYAY